jgi:hypothetical protein
LFFFIIAWIGGFVNPQFLGKLIGVAEALPCDTFPSFHALGSVTQPDRNKEGIEDRQANHQRSLNKADKQLCPVRRLLDSDHTLGFALLESGNHSQTSEHEQIQESQDRTCDIDPEEDFFHNIYLTHLIFFIIAQD